MAQDPSVKIKADTSEFRREMRGINESMNMARSQFRLAQSSANEFGNSTESLQNKAKYLNSAITIQKEKVEALRAAMQDAAARTGTDSEQTQKLARQFVNAQTQLNKFNNELRNTNRELNEHPSRYQRISERVGEMGNRMKEAGEKMSAVGSHLTQSITVPVFNAVKSAVEGASDLNETLGKSQVVFGNHAKSVETWSNSSVKNFGLAKSTALDMASTYGDMASGMGLTQEAAAKMGEQLVGRAADLASFKNISTDTAKEALTGVFTGEGEALKGLGIIMTQDNLNRFAQQQGIQKTVQKMSQQEQVQLRYNYVMAMSKNAAGDFARTSDSTANSIRSFHENVKDLSEKLATNLLPVLAPIVQKMIQLVQWFGQLATPIQGAILGFVAFLAAIGPVVSIVGALSTAFGAVMSFLSPVIAAVGEAGGVFAVLTGPIGLVVGAIAAFTAGLVTLWNTNSSFRNAVIEAWHYIQTVFTTVWSAITSFIHTAIPAAMNALSPMIHTIWSGIVSFLGIAWQGFSTVFSTVVSAIRTVWTAMSPAIHMVFSTLVGILKTLWQTFKVAFTITTEAIKLTFTAVVNILKVLWTSATTVISGLWRAFGPVFSVVCNVLSATFKGVTGLITTIWNGVVNGIKHAWEGIKAPFKAVVDFIGNIWKGIKNGFKLPHFKLSGSLNPLEWGSKGPPSIGVDWYAKGGIFTRPTVLGGIGVGDANNGAGSNAEAVLPIDALFNSMNQYFDSRLGDGSVNVYLDSDLIAKYTINQISNKMAMANRRAR